MDKFIPLSVPNLKGNELKYVTEAIETEWVSTGGAYIDRYESEFANYLNLELPSPAVIVKIVVAFDQINYYAVVSDSVISST